MGDGRGELFGPAFVAKGLVKAGDFFPEGLFQDDFVDIQALFGKIVMVLLDGFPEVVEEPGAFVDGQGGVVAPDVAHQGIEDGGQMRAHRGTWNTSAA